MSSDKEELITFWKSSASVSGSIQEFLKNFSVLQDRAFFYSLAHISGKTAQTLPKILLECVFG